MTDNRVTLKSFYETGDFPTEPQFAALIDGTLNLAEDFFLQINTTTISVAQISDLNSTPIQLVAAPGAGFANISLAVLFRMTFNTTPWDTNTILSIGHTIAAPISDAQIEFDTFLDKGEDTFAWAGLPFLGSDPSNVGENKSLILRAPTGNPLNGDSPITIILIHSVITV